MKKVKTLKIWNGRSQGHENGQAYVAAYSQKQAAELLSKAFNSYTTVNEIRQYFAPCWGTRMEEITPTEPCVYYAKGYGTNPTRIL